MKRLPRWKAGLLVVAFMALFVAVFLAGCAQAGGSAGEQLADEMEQEVWEESSAISEESLISEESWVEESSSSWEEESLVAEETEPEVDEYKDFLVSRIPGETVTLLLRNGNHYIIGGTFTKPWFMPGIDYEAGCVYKHFGTGNTISRYLYQDDGRDWSDVVSVGKVPILKVRRQDGDKVVYYAKSDKDALQALILFPVTSRMRYTIGLEKVDHSYLLTDPDNEMMYTWDYKGDEGGERNVLVVDAAGNSVAPTDDGEGFIFKDLVYDAEYTVSWYQGTQYYEQTVKADCEIFSYDNENRYELEPTLTKDGYVEYDLANMAAGLYVVYNGAGNGSSVVEII